MKRTNAREGGRVIRARNLVDVLVLFPIEKCCFKLSWNWQDRGIGQEELPTPSMSGKWRSPSQSILRRMSNVAHAARTPKLRSQHSTAVGFRVFAVEQVTKKILGRSWILDCMVAEELFLFSEKNFGEAESERSRSLLQSKYGITPVSYQLGSYSECESVRRVVSSAPPVGAGSQRAKRN